MMRTRTVVLTLLGVCAAIGCSKKEGAEGSHHEAWRLAVTYKGSEVRVPNVLFGESIEISQRGGDPRLPPRVIIE
jgi:hypothetical protein